MRTYASPLGPLEIEGTAQGILAIRFVERAPETSEDAKVPECITECMRQLNEYFEGKRREFSLNLILQGTDFQKKVWQELSKIPYGETLSYKDLARKIGQEKAVRGVGAANSHNPIPIVIPCHRVIGSNGRLTGYTGGLWRKRWLLKHEGISVKD